LNRPGPPAAAPLAGDTLTIAARRPGRLPAEITGFVGRQRELADLARTLSSARLVTVTGPGGVGKTRVALRCAAQLASGFTHGVCLVELSGLRDRELLPHTVATALGLPERDDRSQLDAVLDYLRDRQLLLILDTCEHLVDACGMLAEVLLRATTGVRVLATSRQTLDVPGEHTCPIPPLRVPDDAVELFAQRAAAVVPGFVVDEANRDSVIALCRRLDGVPLALELATVRLRALSLGQLSERLEDRFRLLTGGRRAALPHHQTLRTATEWSYDLCTPAEQLLWARLSVFAGSFDVAAAEEVCAGPGAGGTAGDGEGLARGDVLANLVGLVDKSVVLRVDGEETRYRLLDTIREFGAEKLAASGGRRTARERHIARYVRMAAHFGYHALGNDQVPQFRRLRAEHDDIRVTLDYALTLSDHDLDAAIIATGLFGYWQISGLLGEGRYWLHKVLPRLGGTTLPGGGIAPDPPRGALGAVARARALIVDSNLATLQGAAEEGIAIAEQAIATAEATGDKAAAGFGYMYLCLGYLLAGRYDEALATGTIAEQRATAASDQASLVFIDYEMGYLNLLTGKLDEGIARCDQGLARLGPDTGEIWIRGFLHLLKGLALYLKGEHAASADAFFRGLAMKHEIDDTLGMGYALEGLANLAAAAGRYTRTAWLLGAADEMWQLVGSRLGKDPFLESLHRQTERTTRDALGADQFTMLFRRGGDTPLDQIVALAAGDADELRAGPAGGTAGSGFPLTGRELEIAALVAEGLSNREIAAKLGISKRTVDAHIEHIFGKLGVSSRVQLATWLTSSGGSS
jgi:predicted ATPase/DNA-binding CsgD family transcriptional regulator